MRSKRVVVGLSGGVDSSVAALLIIEQGYEVEGVYLECYNEPGCRTDQDKADALKVALKLGIPFRVLDFRKEYQEKVIEYFYADYEAGRTPNPDVVCNREIKFGMFYDYAIDQGYDYVATGHYARIKEVSSPSSSKFSKFLQRARDESKDQSYFLWQIPRDHLEHILFPLGELRKSEVRAIAKKHNLVTASKPDSMGICFLGEVNVVNLLKEKLGENEGEVVMGAPRNEPGKYSGVGRHKGLWFYTIGERGGFEIDKSKLKKLGMHPESMGPLYVIGKNVEANQLVVGSREETMTAKLRVWNKEQGRWNMVGATKLWVRIRNLGELVEVESLSNLSAQAGPSSGEIEIDLGRPVFGVASGQSAVFYDAEGVLVNGSIIV